MTFYASYAFGVVLFMCEIGQQLTNAFETIEDTFEAFHWYLFPLETKKMLLLIIMVTQEPVVMQCFGSTSGTRDTFKKVSLSNKQ